MSRNVVMATRAPRSFNLASALLVSVAVHLVMVLVWIGGMVAEVFQTSRTVVEEAIEEETQYLTIQPEMFERVEVPPVLEAPPPPARAEKEFQETHAGQETVEAPKETRYFGERNTLAASEGEVLEEGLEVPSQDGAEARSPGEFKLFDSQFVDGETEGLPGAGGENAPEPGEPELVSRPMVPSDPVLREEPEEEEREPTAEERLERAKQEAARLLALDESVAVPAREDIPEPKAEAAEEEKIPEPKKEERPVAELRDPGGLTGQPGAEDGFRTESRRTRLRGTIRRVGESSLDVEDSVKGRFLAAMNKAIERAWQRECLLRREHILPGAITLSFDLNERGKTSAFSFDARIAGGSIQEGFTMRAIQKAKIPEMPEEMKKELAERPLRLTLTFFFN